MNNYLLDTEKIEIKKTDLLNNGLPFNTLDAVNDYLNSLKELFDNDMIIYNYKNLSEIALNRKSFDLFNKNVLPLTGAFQTIYNFYKIIGKRVILIEKTINGNQKIISYPYACCLIGLYCPTDQIDLLYKKTKHINVYYKTEYTVLNTNIKEINNEKILDDFTLWLNLSTEKINDIQTVNNNAIKYEIFNYQ